MPTLKRLCRLSVYCSENLLLSEPGIIQLAMESSSSTPAHELSKLLSFDSRLQEAVNLLLPLFVLYAVVQELDLTIETTSFAVVRLCRIQSQPETLCPKLIKQRMREVIAQIRAARSWADYLAAKSKVLAQVSAWKRPKADFISGKSYLLPLARLLLKATVGFGDSLDGLRVRLAAYTNLDIDETLATRLIDTANS